MKIERWLKLGQILGFALVAAGVVVYIVNEKQGFSELMLLGALVYAGCRMALWLRAT